tara:strand:- start:29 stop:445 length:417 start_codon:yes stop_codon:yes gene_type:complete
LKLIKKVICGIIYNENFEILITRRAKGDYAGKWEFPGGKVENRESNEECLHRELFEELKIRVIIHFKFTEYILEYPKFYVNLISYICSTNEKEIKLSDHDRYKWVKTNTMSDFIFLTADSEILTKLKNENNRVIKELI